MRREIPRRVEDFEVSYWRKACLEPARDYLDVIQITANRWIIGVGCVTGFASLPRDFMTNVSSIVKKGMEDTNSLAATMRLLNHQMAETNPGRFMTLLLILVSPLGKAELINAGHCEPCAHPTTTEQALRHDADIPLGVIPDEDFSSIQFLLQPDATLAIFSDGLSYALNAQDEYFDLTSVQGALAEGGTADQIRDRIQQAVLEHIGEATVFDDISLMIVKRTIG